MNSGPTLSLRIGNTYQRLDRSEAQLDRTRSNYKVHDCILFVDVESRQEDWIDNVTFDLGATFKPQKFVCPSPVPAGRGMMRFKTRQQTYGPVTATIHVQGVGGTRQSYQHTLSLSRNGTYRRNEFTERRSPRPIRPVRVPDELQFGVELELTSGTRDASQVATHVSSVSGLPVAVADSYQAGRQTYDSWKLVPDSSIVCNRSQPDCHKFELVSPILHGGPGLSQLHHITKALSDIPIRVNKSMGFHLHIDVSHMELEQLIKICQNFIKYEHVMDSFMPPSRRTGSDESDRYFSSNREAVSECLRYEHYIELFGNRDRHYVLADCQSLEELAKCMNYDKDDGMTRYFKLNLQNLVTGRQPTLEFRQHSSTTDYRKISSWIRFCIRLCVQSARLASPSFLKESTTQEEAFENLFWYVIKDRALRNYYRERQANHDEACCETCAAGRLCRAVHE